MGLCFLWFYVQELPKAQLAVVLVLKRLRRRGNGLKSHPTDLLFFLKTHTTDPSIKLVCVCRNNRGISIVFKVMLRFS